MTEKPKQKFIVIGDSSTTESGDAEPSVNSDICQKDSRPLTVSKRKLLRTMNNVVSKREIFLTNYIYMCNFSMKFSRV